MCRRPSACGYSPAAREYPVGRKCERALPRKIRNRSRLCRAVREWFSCLSVKPPCGLDGANTARRGLSSVLRRPGHVRPPENFCDTLEGGCSWQTDSLLPARCTGSTKTSKGFFWWRACFPSYCSLPGRSFTAISSLFLSNGREPPYGRKNFPAMSLSGFPILRCASPSASVRPSAWTCCMKHFLPVCRG